jgi:hypothetical protein
VCLCVFVCIIRLKLIPEPCFFALFNNCHQWAFHDCVKYTSKTHYPHFGGKCICSWICVAGVTDVDNIKITSPFHSCEAQEVLVIYTNFCSVYYPNRISVYSTFPLLSDALQFKCIAVSRIW